ncbi:hypothetical protein WPG_0805 [Winogradskyella sp. PG-2]|nr:hypothetical protein WPG_0805 [Winogradskyella sp. PG-2]
MFNSSSLTTLSINDLDFKTPISVSKEVLGPANSPKSSNTEISEFVFPLSALSLIKIVEDTS